MREQAKKMNVASLKQNEQSDESTEMKIAKVTIYKLYKKKIAGIVALRDSARKTRFALSRLP